MLIAANSCRMRNASVLIVTLRGLASEVCKNIVLAGIGSLTLLDDQDVSEEDLGSCYFYRDKEVGQKVGGCSILLRCVAKRAINDRERNLLNRGYKR